MLQKNNDPELLGLFFRKPHHPFHLREMCRMLRWSTTKVRKETGILKKKGIITESMEKGLSIFRPGTENEEFKRLKIIYNISKALEIAGIVEGEIEDFGAIIFFGSALRGEDSENSDFDICITGAKEKAVPLQGKEKEIERKISLLFIERPERLKMQNRELLNNLINGLVVKGYFKVF